MFIKLPVKRALEELCFDRCEIEVLLNVITAVVFFTLQREHMNRKKKEGTFCDGTADRVEP